MQEVLEKESKFEKLVEDASGPAAVDEAVAKQLHESWTTLHDAVTSLIRGRHDSLKHSDAYHKQMMELTGCLDNAAAAADAVKQCRDAELSHKLTQMKVAELDITDLSVT